MKNYFRGIILLCLIVTYISCSKDSANEQNDTTTVSPRSSNYSFDSNDPFYSSTYVTDTLSIPLTRTLASSIMYDFKQEVQDLLSVFDSKENITDEFGYPCWSCGEVDYNVTLEKRISFVPLVDITNSSVNGLLIREYDDLSPQIKFVNRKIFESRLASGDIDYEYWSRVFTYVDELVDGDGTKPDFIDIAAYKSKDCVPTSSTGWCFCGDQRICYDEANGGFDDCIEEKCDVNEPTHEIDHTAGPTGGGTYFPPIFDWPPFFTENWTFNWSEFIEDIINNNPNGGNNPNNNGGPSIPIPPQDPFVQTIYVDQILTHIDNNTNITLTAEQFNVITDLTNFDNIIFAIANEKELITAQQLSIFLTFLAHHVGYFGNGYYSFIEQYIESVYMLHTDNVTFELDEYLPNYDGSQLLVNYSGRFVLANFMLNTFTNTTRKIFNRLSFMAGFVSSVSFPVSPEHLLLIYNADADLFTDQTLFTEWAYEIVTDAITIEELESNLEVIDFVQDQFDNDGEEKVYYNQYGYGGLLQMHDGYWIYERSESWFEDEGNVHYIYINNKWERYDPPSLPPEIHLLDALVASLVNGGHNTLDLFGLVPGVGEIFDGINSIWYYAEGDYVNGSISAASMVPVVGNAVTASKWARNTLALSDQVFHSQRGLKYLRVTGEHRLTHVFRHTEDDLSKSLHGIFNDKDDVIGIIDDAWDNYLSGTNILRNEPISGGRREIVIELGHNIGVEGGYAGSGDALTKLKIIIESGSVDEIVTAYPIKYHP